MHELVVSLCAHLLLFLSISVYEGKDSRKRSRTVGTHRSDTGPHLAPSSNFHKIYGRALNEEERGDTECSN